MYQQGSKYVIYINFFFLLRLWFSVLILSSIVNLSLNSISLALAPNFSNSNETKKIFKSQKPSISLRIGLQTNLNSKEHEKLYTRNWASQEAQIPWKSLNFSKVILKNYILYQHLITNDHKEPFSKFVPPQKFKSHEK